MNIIVCIKQVPDTTEVKIDPETNTLVRDGVSAVMNPFDKYAVEEGVRLRERYGGKVTALTMGPARAEEILKEAISTGVDEGVLLSDRVFAGSDTWATSYILAKAIEKLGHFDVIICGKQASDGDTAQVGPGISAHLDIPQVTYVRKIRQKDGNRFTVERLVEEGFEVIEVNMPCLFTVVKEINEPRLPSLKGIMKAKKQEIKTLTNEDLGINPDLLGLKGSPTRVIKTFTPSLRSKRQMIKGEISEIVDKLIEVLKGNKSS